MKKLTDLQRKLYNNLLDLSWDQPYIQYADLYVNFWSGDVSDELLQEGTSFAETLRALESAKKVLCGPEDVEGVLLHTVSPIVKGGIAYSHPSDHYTTRANFLAIHQLPEAV